MLVIATIFAVASLIWAAVAIRYGGLALGCLLVVVAGSIFGHSFFHLSVLTLDRVLLIALCGLYVLYRHCGWHDPKPWSVADVALLLLLIALSLGTFSGDWRVNNAQPASRFLLLYAMPAALYWVARQSRLSRRQVNWIFAAVGTFAIYLAITALAEMTGQTGLVYPRYIITSAYDEFLGRGRGPFLNPVANGLYLSTGLACWAMMWPAQHRSTRAILLAAGILILAGSFATLTRCVWLGTGLVLLFLITLGLSPRQRWGVLIVSTCLGLVTLSLSWHSVMAFKRDTHLSAAKTAESMRLRPMLAIVGWQMFLDHPLLGVGLGQYKEHDQSYIAARTVDLPLDRIRPYHQHNVILSLLCEAGLLGTIPFVVLLSCWTRIAWRFWQDGNGDPTIRRLGPVFLAALISYLTSGMFQDVALIPMTNLLLFFLAGLTVSAASSSSTCAAPIPEASQQIRQHKFCCPPEPVAVTH